MSSGTVPPPTAGGPGTTRTTTRWSRPPTNCADSRSRTSRPPGRAAYSGFMNSDTTNNQKSPDGSTDVSNEDKTKAEALPDGSQSDGTPETDEDTVSGGSAD
jgi:hypothetical protein